MNRINQLRMADSSPEKAGVRFRPWPQMMGLMGCTKQPERDFFRRFAISLSRPLGNGHKTTTKRPRTENATDEIVSLPWSHPLIATASDMPP
jgi:hypothetical protein